MSKIKSFRGNIADDGIDTIVLHTNDGSTGYRMVRFEVMADDFTKDSNAVVLVNKVKPATASSTIDFNNQVLLAAAFYSKSDTPHNHPEDMNVIFDSEIFNQDIYISYKNVLTSNPPNINYYIELEQIKLDLNENTVATLKDIRNIEAQWANNII